MLRLETLRDWSLLVLKLSDVDDIRDPVDCESSFAMSLSVLRNVTLACHKNKTFFRSRTRTNEPVDFE